MLRQAMQLLRPAGRLVFSTNYSRFKLDRVALEEFEIEDISARTIPKDFERHARIHRCFVLRHRGAAP
jgi:23S rRNA (guanine2445-N2)-methyltransferase / 23S rRNA (guanine2069-N7)-methyltransferase